MLHLYLATVDNIDDIINRDTVITRGYTCLHSTIYTYHNVSTVVNHTNPLLKLFITSIEKVQPLHVIGHACYLIKQRRITLVTFLFCTLLFISRPIIDCVISPAYTNTIYFIIIIITHTPGFSNVCGNDDFMHTSRRLIKHFSLVDSGHERMERNDTTTTCDSNKT